MKIFMQLASKGLSNLPLLSKLQANNMLTKGIAWHGTGFSSPIWLIRVHRERRGEQEEGKGSDL